MVEKKRVSLFGATGSIGASTIDVLKRHKNRFQVEVVTANKKARELAAVARALDAKLAVVFDPAAYRELREALMGSGITCAAGEAALLEAAARPADLIMMAISGAAGLKAAYAAAATGATLALANKESLVCAGGLLIEKISAAGGRLLPVDSEHNAIFQLLEGRDDTALSKVTLTASGGPFRDWTIEEMVAAQPKDAISHPIWKMGDKISVDCATLMNKGLELIEAQHLFNLQPDQLDVLVHPQSIVHALIEFRDGSVLAQMAVPDMRVAISYCLGWPERLENGAKPLDLAQIKSLTFEKPDEQRFPCLELARQAMQQGGLMPCVLSAANEIATAAFLEGGLEFTAISGIIAAALDRAAGLGFSRPGQSLDDVLEADRQGRAFAASFLPHYDAKPKWASA